MSSLKKQKEYAQVDLYYKNNPRMDSQNMSAYIREILNNAEDFVDSYDINLIKIDLKNEKRIFLSKIISSCFCSNITSNSSSAFLN